MQSVAAVAPKAGTVVKGSACTVCRKRKHKCSGSSPCTYCTKNSLECIFLPKRYRGASKKKPNNAADKSPDNSSKTEVSLLEEIIGSEIERSSFLDLHKCMGKFGMVTSMVIDSNKIIFAATPPQRMLLCIIFANVSYSFGNVKRAHQYWNEARALSGAIYDEISIDAALAFLFLGMVPHLLGVASPADQYNHISWGIAKSLGTQEGRRIELLSCFGIAKKKKDPETLMEVVKAIDKLLQTAARPVDFILAGFVRIYVSSFRLLDLMKHPYTDVGQLKDLVLSDNEELSVHQLLEELEIVEKAIEHGSPPMYFTFVVAAFKSFVLWKTGRLEEGVEVLLQILDVFRKGELLLLAGELGMLALPYYVLHTAQRYEAAGKLLSLVSYRNNLSDLLPFLPPLPVTPAQLQIQQDIQIEANPIFPSSTVAPHDTSSIFPLPDVTTSPGSAPSLSSSTSSATSSPLTLSSPEIPTSSVSTPEAIQQDWIFPIPVTITAKPARVSPASVPTTELNNKITTATTTTTTTAASLISTFESDYNNNTATTTTTTTTTAATLISAFELDYNNLTELLLSPNNAFDLIVDDDLFSTPLLSD